MVERAKVLLWPVAMLAVAWLAGAPLMADAARRVDEGQAPNQHPVHAVADGRLAVGAGLLPLYVSQDWSHPLPGVTRAVIVIHGRLRNAETYYHSAEAAAAAAGPAAAGSLLVAPQFLAGVDMAGHDLPPATLHWDLTSWMGGDPAEGPAPLSSFDALDALLAKLGDRSLFPNLRTVVVAGHSGGGQVVQRYAVLGRGGDKLAASGIAVRYVVANPSSYAYFSPDRPVAGSTAFAPPGNPSSCPGYDTWKYGMNALPPYAGQASSAAIEAAYAARQVVYLWGGADTNPNQPALDKSCAAELQGPYRLARGESYFAYLKGRDPHLAHTAAIVPGVGHDGDAMFTSPQGLKALFDKQ